jgi:hypothetical protein
VKLLHLHDGDNVAVALQPLAAGDVLDGVSVCDEIPAMHKIAVRAIKQGDKVRKYWQPIGVATRDIAPGEHVHSHNCGMIHSRQVAVPGSWLTVTEYVAKADCATFTGYRREDGRAGTRNFISVIASVNCSATVARQVVALAERRGFGVYMGMPFLVPYSQLTGEIDGMEEAVNELSVARRYLRDDKSGLYWDAWNEKAEQVWADPETGRSQIFWSRGMGCYAMALVDLLDFVPVERADLRQPIIDAIGEFADALLAQRADGFWYQVTDRRRQTGNYPEASSNSMFVYMLAKAVNNGYLDNSYAAASADAYMNVLREFIAVHASGSVSLVNNCQVAGLVSFPGSTCTGSSRIV